MQLVSLRELEPGRLYKLVDGWVTGFVGYPERGNGTLNGDHVNWRAKSGDVILVVQKIKSQRKLECSDEFWYVQVLHKDVLTWIDYLYHNCNGSEFMWEPL